MRRLAALHGSGDPAGRLAHDGRRALSVPRPRLPRLGGWTPLHLRPDRQRRRMVATLATSLHAGGAGRNARAAGRGGNGQRSAGLTLRDEAGQTRKIRHSRNTQSRIRCSRNRSANQGTRSLRRQRPPPAPANAMASTSSHGPLLRCHGRPIVRRRSGFRGPSSARRFHPVREYRRLRRPYRAARQQGRGPASCRQFCRSRCRPEVGNVHDHPMPRRTVVSR
jgi:hypothetical protein